MKYHQGTVIPPYPHIDGKTWAYPCYAENKKDGEANIYSNGVLISKASGRIRYDCPITNLLSQIVDNDTILFGELHWEDGKAGALYDFLSHAFDDKLKFTIFDVHNPKWTENMSYEDRKEWLMTNIREHPIYKKNNYEVGTVRIPSPNYIENEAMLTELIQKNKDEGWEGLVIKQPDSLLYAIGGKGIIVSQQHWVKIKHKTTGDYEVRSISPTQERMEVWVGDKVKGRTVGVKLVNKYKPFVNVGDIVEIEHQGVLSSGGLRHPTFLGKVVIYQAKAIRHTTSYRVMMV